jgi:hypothetical protein
LNYENSRYCSRWKKVESRVGELKKSIIFVSLKTQIMLQIPTSSTIGTSFHGSSFNATPNQLIKAIGEITNGRSGDGKVTMEWVRELDNAEVITVYDWKYNRVINMDEEIEWNIGGRNKRATEEAKEKILMLLSK